MSFAIINDFIVVDDVTLYLKQNFKDVERNQHCPDKEHDNSHSPDAILANSLSLIQLEDMHVINFILTVDRNTEAHAEQCITHHKSETHYWTTGLEGIPKKLTLKDVFLKMD